MPKFVFNVWINYSVYEINIQNDAPMSHFITDNYIASSKHVFENLANGKNWKIGKIGIKFWIENQKDLKFRKLDKAIPSITTPPDQNHIFSNCRHWRRSCNVGRFRSFKPLLQEQKRPGCGSIHGRNGHWNADPTPAGPNSIGIVRIPRCRTHSQRSSIACGPWLDAASARQMALERRENRRGNAAVHAIHGFAEGGREWWVARNEDAAVPAADNNQWPQFAKEFLWSCHQFNDQWHDETAYIPANHVQWLKYGAAGVRQQFGEKTEGVCDVTIVGAGFYGQQFVGSHECKYILITLSSKWTRIYNIPPPKT